MIWTRNNLYSCLGAALLLHSCAIYSFSGSSLSDKEKTFSVQRFQSEVALGPADLAEKFTEKLTETLLQRAPLSQVKTRGDLQFEGTITQFEYKPVAATSVENKNDQANITRLTITVQVNYINPHKKDFVFNKKRFTQYADMAADSNTDSEEARLVKEIFTKLVNDIFNVSVAAF